MAKLTGELLYRMRLEVGPPFDIGSGPRGHRMVIPFKGGRFEGPKLNGEVLITGHSDNVPIRSMRYPSNWHLSAARAESVRLALSAQVDPARLRADGRRETGGFGNAADPVGAAGRHRERRRRRRPGRVAWPGLSHFRTNQLRRIVAEASRESGNRPASIHRD